MGNSSRMSGYHHLLLLPPLSGPVIVSGHANMVWPHTWFDQGGYIGMTPGLQCAAGNPGACMWFTNYTFIPGYPSSPDDMRTFQDMYIEGMGNYDWTTKNPWRAPGTAPLYSPCGVAGGNPDGSPVGGPEGDCPGGGFGYGPAAEFVEFPGVVTTEWKLGGTGEVGWGIIANHGGGYSYRLCKVPEGSQWTKNPIPACNSMDGGWFESGPLCPDSGPQFTPPAPGLLGYGENYLAPGAADFLFTIMDRVVVPTGIVPGDYVLSFRWDCEQTSQIWNACSSIRIVE